MLTDDIVEGTTVTELSDATIKAYDFNKYTIKNKEEKTYMSQNKKELYVYVPEEVCADLDELEGKTVTIILGEDNIAALVIIEDDLTETALLTKFDDGKVVVDGESYKLAETYSVELNGKGYGNNSLQTALDHIDDEMDLKAIEKAIEATLTLDEKNKVTAIELFASCDIENVSKEALVKRVRETKSQYKIETTNGTIAWDLEDEEEETIKLPKVYIDGTKADIRDIEAGNVLTILYNQDTSVEDVDDIEKIYVSANTVTGEATRVKKANNAITVDGTVYAPTNMDVTNKLTMEEELKDATFENFASNKVLDTEITLYLNIFGEYTHILAAEASSDYQFGVVTYVSTRTEWEGDEDEIAVISMKVLLPDGNKVTFKVKTDDEDKDTPTAQELADYITPSLEGRFVMFEADANKVIMLDEKDEKAITDNSEIVKIKEITYADAGEIAGEYFVREITGYTVNKDDEEFVNVNDIYAYDSEETVIFNTVEKDIVPKWATIVSGNAFVSDSGSKTLAIFEDDEADVPMFIVVSLGETKYSSSDAKYATVFESAYEEGEDHYVEFVEGEPIKLDSSVVGTLTNINGKFVEYAMKSSKVSNAALLVDVSALAELDEDDVITGGIINSGFETKSLLADNRDVTIKAVAKAGKYVVDYPELFKFDGRDDNAVLATYEFESVFPINAKAGEKYHIVQTNHALAAAFPTGHASGIKAKTYTIGTNAKAGEELVVLIEDGQDVDVKVYKGESADEANLIATYTINDPVVTPTTELEEVTVEATRAGLVKDNFTVAGIKEYKNYMRLSYKDFSDIENYDVPELSYVNVDKAAVVYDLTSGELVEASISDIEEGDLVIAFKNLDCDEKAQANVLVIIK